MVDTGLIEHSTQMEISAFENFIVKYKKMFPTPERVAVTLRDTIGWQFWLAIIQSVFAIMLASMRTADMFYKIAISSSPLLAYIEAIAAVGAVEGGIVVYSSLRAEMQNRKSTGNVQIDAKLAITASTWRLLTGELLGLAVSIVAGLGLSFTGLGIPADGFKFWLAITIGAGASIIAVISGDVLGTTLSRLSNAKDRAAAIFKVEQKTYDETMYARWTASDERKIARGELKAAIRSSSVSTPGSRPVNTHGGNGNNAIRESIYAYLDGYIAKNPTSDQFPGPSEISRNLNVAKSYASQVVHEWLDLHVLKGESCAMPAEPVINPNGHVPETTL